METAETETAKKRGRKAGVKMAKKLDTDTKIWESLAFLTEREKTKILSEIKKIIDKKLKDILA